MGDARSDDAVRALRPERDAVNALADAAEVPEVGAAVPDERLRGACAAQRERSPGVWWGDMKRAVGIERRDLGNSNLDDLAAAVAAGDDALPVVAPLDVVDRAGDGGHLAFQVLIHSPHANLARLREETGTERRGGHQPLSEAVRCCGEVMRRGRGARGARGRARGNAACRVSLYLVGAHHVARGHPASVRRELRDGGRVLVVDVGVGLERVLQGANNDALSIGVDNPHSIRVPAEDSGAPCV